MWLARMADLLNENAGSITAVFTVVVALSTIAYSYFTYGIVREQRLLRQHETQPAISIFVTPSDSWLTVLELVVRNQGRSAALNVRWRVEPSLEELAQFGIEISQAAFLAGLTHLAPGQEIRTFLGSATDLLTDPILPPFTMTAEYEDAHGASLLTPVTIDVRQFEGIRRIGTPALRDVADAADRLAKAISSVVSAGQLKVVTTTERDIEKRNKRWLRQARGSSRSRATTVPSALRRIWERVTTGQNG